MLTTPDREKKRIDKEEENVYTEGALSVCHLYVVNLH